MISLDVFNSCFHSIDRTIPPLLIKILFTNSIEFNLLPERYSARLGVGRRLWIFDYPRPVESSRRGLKLSRGEANDGSFGAIKGWRAIQRGPRLLITSTPLESSRRKLHSYARGIHEYRCNVDGYRSREKIPNSLRICTSKFTQQPPFWLIAVSRIFLVSIMFLCDNQAPQFSFFFVFRVA